MSVSPGFLPARVAPPSVDVQRWQRARRILCVRLDNLGDVLMTTPAMRALKVSAPDRHLTLLGSASGVAAARHVPEIDAAIRYDAPWVKHAGAVEDADALRRDHALIETLRAGQFDAAVIFTVFSQSALPAAMSCRLAGIPLRLAHCRENPYQLLTDWVPDPDPAQGIRHEVRRQLDLVAAVGARCSDERLSFAPREAEHAEAAQVLVEAGVDPAQPFVLLHPGASAASRRYPPELFARAADDIAARLDCPLLFGGSGDDEIALVEQVRSRMHRDSISVAGRLSLGGYAAAIAAARLLVSNNSGPVHLAAAVGTSVVDLYAQTNPQHTPWLVAQRVLFHDVPCRNCFKSVCPEGHHDCLRRVPPEDVAEAAAELFGATIRSAAAPRCADSPAIAPRVAMEQSA